VNSLGHSPIRAELTGWERCAALGITAVGYAPVTMLARKLIRAGVDPGRPFEAYRDGTLALRARSLAAAARVTVRDDNRGVPRFVGYRAPRAARQRQQLPEATGCQVADASK
jgi:hypothetical protein